jgi:hypothetical protein
MEYDCKYCYTQKNESGVNIRWCKRMDDGCKSTSIKYCDIANLTNQEFSSYMKASKEMAERAAKSILDELHKLGWDFI